MAKNNEIAELIKERIESLRPKLLDLSARNPLLSTKFSDRSNSVIRIVDGLPSFLLEKIATERMRFVSLPPLEKEPKDENEPKFQEALTIARSDDKEYLEAIDSIDHNKNDSANLLAQAERSLKDKIRESLDMPPRSTSDNPSLPQHAKNHHISPSYDLPAENEKHPDGRHADKNIQTLLLSDVMNRKLNALNRKEKVWKDETGISVIQMAFGFLEWQDPKSKKKQYAPLVLMPVQLEQKRTARGETYWINSDEAIAEQNKILTEKLNLEFGIKLPEFYFDAVENTNSEIEKYFSKIDKLKPKTISVWKVRRQVAVGVFPSARLAMYHDLDPAKWDFSSHAIISTLFAGAENESNATPFADEYEIDKPEIENKVPLLITDADSSQFSTIVDVMNGKNLAVEGPPGTGKSQTIVNTIAASLSKGNKVLFVAEKTAALEVVQSKLQAFGLGEFLLPLQASRASKTAVYQSIKDRVEIEIPQNVSSDRELQRQKEDLNNSRNGLKTYIDILSSSFGPVGENSNFTVHKILGNYIKIKHIWDALPENIKQCKAPAIENISNENISKRKLEKIISMCEATEQALAGTSNQKNYWQNIQIANVNPIQAEDKLLPIATQIAEIAHNIEAERKKLEHYNFSAKEALKTLSDIKDFIAARPNINKKDINVAKKIKTSENIEEIQSYCKKADTWNKNESSIKEHIVEPLDKFTLEKITNINTILEYQDGSFRDFYQTTSKELSALSEIKNVFQESEKISADLFSLQTNELVKIVDLISSSPKEILDLRQMGFDEVRKQTILNKAKLKAGSLQEMRDVIRSKFDLPTLDLYSTKEIQDNILTIQNIGFLNRFSIKCRVTKKLYKSIYPSSKNRFFRKFEALNHLQKILQYKKECEAFLNNNEYKDTFLEHFDSIDIDFSPFESIVSLFKEIDTYFGENKFLNLRKWIKESPTKEIKSIPKIGEAHSIRQIFNFKIEYINEQMTKLDDDLSVLNENKKIFKNSDELSKETISELVKKLGILLKEQDYVKNNDGIKFLLGDYFDAEQTDIKKLENCLQFSKQLTNFSEKLKNNIIQLEEETKLPQLHKLILTVEKEEKTLYEKIERLASSTNTKPQTWFANDNSFEMLARFMDEASKDKAGLIAHSRLFAKKQELIKEGYAPFLEAMFDNNKHNLAESIKSLIFRKMASSVYKKHPDLADYNGVELNKLRKQFQKADKSIIELSQKQLREKLSHANPPAGNSRGKKSTYTNMSLLGHEISKKQAHPPIRKLVEMAGEALLELKPCWMMSPLAVAQYLEKGNIEKGNIEFDLLIIDEASQMTPEDSIGALVRSKQAMIVGDTNQLPPTPFFRKVLDDDEEDEDIAVTEESILEIANSRLRPKRRLRWHYRSKHSKLIAFSNKQIYNDSLIVFPSPQETNSIQSPQETDSIQYCFVEGNYSSGQNHEEAKIMINAIIKFMAEEPDKSLGVAVMNKKQCDLLNELFNFESQKEPHVKKYLEEWEEKNEGLEDFFIKNLENVQGDERDVIFIGTVYGPQQPGARVMQRFGPINGVAGKRRLNVLFSRAKHKIVTFSSMTAADIQEGNPGATMLKHWLEYSASGGRTLFGGELTGREPDSPFEEHVIEQTKSIGCEAVPQIGVEGYYIDIGVKHPDWPHGFLMGVECDGAGYHSSRSARERDRLRQEVLEGLGWHLYRIWSTDWFEDSIRETERLRQAIEKQLERKSWRRN